MDPTIFATADVGSPSSAHEPMGGRSTSTGGLPSSTSSAAVGGGGFNPRMGGRYAESESDGSIDDSPFKVSQRSSPAPSNAGSPNRSSVAQTPPPAQSPRTSGLTSALSNLMGSPKKTSSKGNAAVPSTPN